MEVASGVVRRPRSGRLGSLVVLEIGGLLQHGAVVAREYGKPCIVGIGRVMTKLQDSQRVEVDGTSGVIRLLSQPGMVG